MEHSQRVGPILHTWDTWDTWVTATPNRRRYTINYSQSNC